MTIQPIESSPGSVTDIGAEATLSGAELFTVVESGPIRASSARLVRNAVDAIVEGVLSRQGYAPQAYEPKDKH